MPVYRITGVREHSFGGAVDVRVTGVKKARPGIYPVCVTDKRFGPDAALTVEESGLFAAIYQRATDPAHVFRRETITPVNHGAVVLTPGLEGKVTIYQPFPPHRVPKTSRMIIPSKALKIDCM